MIRKEATVHLRPMPGEGEMPCCGLSPLEFVGSDEMITSNPKLVTCKGEQ